MKYETIETYLEGLLGIIKLNRPEKNNALNNKMIREITHAVDAHNSSPEVRFIIIRANGPVFCAGADLNWMISANKLSYKENYKESLLLAELFYKIYTSKKIVLTVVNGAAYGGGIGILAASDFAFTSDTTTFSFSEVKLGLVPATILPYVMRRMKENHCKELMITGKKFNGNEAMKIGLVSFSYHTLSEMNTYFNDFLAKLEPGPPKAQHNIKHLIQYVSDKEINKNLVIETAEFIANARLSDEAREGMNAFLEKRRPQW